MYSSLNIYNQPVTLAPTTVASPNAAYQRMANFWGLVEDLKEGTYKIRSEHRKYLNQEFTNHLVQTRKFTVLDREFDEEISSELANLASTGNIDDQVKIGQKLFADYILVGRLDFLSIAEIEKKFLTSDVVKKKTIGALNFSYRVIDVPTSQIKYSS